MQNFIQFIVVDLFCGAGGTTLGFENAESNEQHLTDFLNSIGVTHSGSNKPYLKLSQVVACVNHDPLAIKSHWENHPEVEHFEEDITTLYGVVKHKILFKSDQLLRLQRLIDIYRACYPHAKIILWASLECTNFSKAKGGLPRDADSRTLADHLHPYIIALSPDYIKIENVVEFMAWGPLDENGKPISRRNGEDWQRWRKQVCAHGYYDEWKELNAADFGAITSRNRLFGCFAKHGQKIVWPKQTHAKKPEKHIRPLKKWQPVKPALEFDDEGKSIFNRKKPLSPKTMQRLFMGCVKHIAGGKEHYLLKYFSGKPQYKNASVDSPAPSVTTFGCGAIVKASFIDQRNGYGKDRSKSVDDTAKTITSTGGNQQLVFAFIPKWNGDSPVNGPHPGHSLQDPCPTVTTQNRLGLAQAHFIQKYYSGGGQLSSIDEPAGTLSTKDRMAKVHADFFLQKYYNGDHNHQSIDSPAGTLLPNDKHNLVKAEKFLLNGNYHNGGKSIEEPAPTITASRRHHYIVNPGWHGHSKSVEDPCCVIIARQDKAPLYLISCTEGPLSIPVYEDECEYTIKLKEFMALYNICDIKMRMLKVSELKRIQGFPDNYVLLGNQTDQKKFIGNAVHPKVVKVWIQTFGRALIKVAA